MSTFANSPSGAPFPTLFGLHFTLVFGSEFYFAGVKETTAMFVPRNPIGRFVARLRTEKNWSQEVLVARLQRLGVDISRDILARIELGLTRVNLDFLFAIHQIFAIPIIQYFPKAVQELDAKFVQQIAAELSAPAKQPRRKNSRRSCRKLTKT